MPASLEAITAAANRATEQGFRNKLLARGQARAMVWREGVVPEGGPRFADALTYDLLAYGYSLLTQGLRLLEDGGDRDLARSSFASAAEALEAVIANGPDGPDQAFHRLIAAAAYHIGRYSARAFSLLAPFNDADLQPGNLSPMEHALGLLMLRRMDALEALVTRWVNSDGASDASLAARIADALPEGAWEEGPEDASDTLMLVADLALSQGFMSATGAALLAFERGERALLDEAIARFEAGQADAASLSLVPQWWAHRLARHLFDELWNCSFHEVLPQNAPPSLPAWEPLRELFIASLYSRSRAEIDLWPSQIGAAARAMQVAENLVVSLPTSAGKTRIGELCILACLALGKRVMFITPLRALSAQTEVSLTRTFRPLGKTVSGLYGSIGFSGADESLLMERDIVVATPEKLDFALRNDPGLLDDVGLVVLDEGHMIGLGEREVRYEVQIQRLLKRADADQRRIVCLSAILPEGDQLEDFVSWLSNDGARGLVQKDWRPTRLRFGEVEWNGYGAKLNITLGDETPFIPRFLSPRVPPIGRRRTPFPKDQRELVLATTWRLIQDGQTVLIYCPQRRSVEPFAEAIVDLNGRGALDALIEPDDPRLRKALTIGAEWLGEDHVLLRCLRLGVAVHHGALPTPYRREVEALLRDGILKVTVSSPTLAQGLNLAATTLVFHHLQSGRGLIEPHDFRNIVGRAGRAFVDVQGLVLYPMFDKHASRRRDWTDLVTETAGREMESGLVRLIQTLLARMQRKLGTTDLETLMEYVLGMPTWDFEPVPGESADEIAGEVQSWATYMASLDTALLSILGEDAVGEADLATALDNALASSLWTRRLARREPFQQELFRETLVQRARAIWRVTTPEQRRGYFLAGVGLATGQQLDDRSDDLIELLIRANGALSAEEPEIAIDALTAFAEIVFTISPFVPNTIIDDWQSQLRAWLEGRALSTFAQGDSDTLRFLEDAFLYRLPWALEAVRVHGLARGYTTPDGLDLSDFELGLAAGAVETGVMNANTIFLIQAGFASRSAAQIVTQEQGAHFTNLTELRAWLRTPRIAALSDDPAWPTAETHDLWSEFVLGLRPERIESWAREDHHAMVVWTDGPPPDGTPLRMATGSGDEILDLDHRRVGRLFGNLNGPRTGIVKVTARAAGVDITYLGPRDLDAVLI